MSIFKLMGSPQKNAAPMQSYVKKAGGGQLPMASLSGASPLTGKPGANIQQAAKKIGAGSRKAFSGGGRQAQGPPSSGSSLFQGFISLLSKM